MFLVNVYERPNNHQYVFSSGILLRTLCSFALHVLKYFEKKILKKLRIIKNDSLIGPAVWQAIRNIHMNVLFYYMDKLKDPAFFSYFLAYNTHRPPMSGHKKVQLIRSVQPFGRLWTTII